MIIFAICGFNYALGRYSNNQLAQQWLDIVKPVLKQNFSKIGSFDADTEIDMVYFEDQNVNEYPLLLKGRENMIYAKTNLVLEKRHDLATVFFTKIPMIRRLFSVQSDTLWIDIPIERSPTVHSEILLI